MYVIVMCDPLLQSLASAEDLKSALENELYLLDEEYVCKIGEVQSDGSITTD